MGGSRLGGQQRHARDRWAGTFGPIPQQRRRHREHWWQTWARNRQRWLWARRAVMGVAAVALAWGLLGVSQDDPRDRAPQLPASVTLRAADSCELVREALRDHNQDDIDQAMRAVAADGRRRAGTRQAARDYLAWLPGHDKDIALTGVEAECVP